MEATIATIATVAFLLWAWNQNRRGINESAERARARRLNPETVKPDSWQGSAEQTQLHAADNIRKWS